MIPGLVDDGSDQVFSFIDPPFQFNAPNAAEYPVEVSGNFLLRSMAQRLSWSSLKERRLLDYGCGVRLARTIVNLDLPLARYVGVDVNRPAVTWLQENVKDPRFTFVVVDDQNSYYNQDGTPSASYDALRSLSDERFDAASLFSVITHQNPEEAERTFAVLREVLSSSSQLYFTAFLDDTCADYGEAVPSEPGLKSTYNTLYLTKLLKKTGWTLQRIYAPIPFQMYAVVCRPS